MGNLVYTERTPTLKVNQHIDELEFLYLLNLLTLPHIKQRCPYAFLTKKAAGYCIKLLNHRHGRAERTVFRRQLFSQQRFPEKFLTICHPRLAEVLGM